MELRIDALAASALADALAVQKMAFVSEAVLYGDYRLPPLEDRFSEFELEFARKTFLGAWLESELVGVIRGVAQGGTGLIERLAVHPAWQRRGIGAALVSALEKRLNCSRYELFTGERSLGNLRLYQRLGYRRFATQPLKNGLHLVRLEKP